MDLSQGYESEQHSPDGGDSALQATHVLVKSGFVICFSPHTYYLKIEHLKY